MHNGEDGSSMPGGRLEAGGRPVKQVLIADDQRTFSDLLRHALSSYDDLECVGVASTPDEAVALALRLEPDLVLMDVQFAGQTCDGVDATARIRALLPDTLVVLLTGHADQKVLRRAAEAGASSVMPKDGSLPDLLSAIRTVRPGGLVVHPRLLQSLMSAAPSVPSQRPRLSRREVDVLSMLAIGLDVRSISSQLGISPNTCRGYVKNLLSKLHAHSQLEAVAIARRRGLLDEASLLAD
jgi:DNA-binding NarL/FixJ family response regulator